MRPQDIERIAEGVVASFSQRGDRRRLGRRGRLGCAGFGDSTEFTCGITSYTCEANYECGLAAPFNCPVTFRCPQGFFCCPIFSGQVIP